MFEKNSNQFIPWIIKHPLIPQGNFGILLLTILIILVGHITQDITDNLTDSDSVLQKYYPILQTEKDHRFFSLVRKRNYRYELTGLGKEVFNHRNLTQSKVLDRNEFLLAENPDSYFEKICTKS
ncbi:MAG: hypothetical protein WBM62_23255 [Crocosphaera sp.]